MYVAMFLICMEPFITNVRNFTQCIMVNAISDVTSSIPPQNTRALRQFAAQFENWVTESVKNFSADLNQIKVDGNLSSICIDEYSAVSDTLVTSGKNIRIQVAPSHITQS